MPFLLVKLHNNNNNKVHEQLFKATKDDSTDSSISHSLSLLMFKLK